MIYAMLPPDAVCNESTMEVSRNRGPRNRAQYTMIPVIRTPKMGPLILGIHHIAGRSSLLKLFWLPHCLLQRRPHQRWSRIGGRRPLVQALMVLGRSFEAFGSGIDGFRE